MGIVVHVLEDDEVVVKRRDLLDLVDRLRRLLGISHPLYRSMIIALEMDKQRHWEKIGL
jgi:hypothetical protein